MTPGAEAYAEFYARASIIAAIVSGAGTVAVVAWSLIANMKNKNRGE